MEWTTIEPMPDVSAMTPEERAEFYAHLSEGTVPVVLKPLAEIQEMYGRTEAP